VSLPRAFTALSGATAVSMAAQLVRGKLAALLLGPAGVGVFNQLSLLWNLFQIGGALGTGNGIIQHGTEAIASDDQPALRRLVSTSTVLLGAFSCLLAAVGVALSPAISSLLLHDGGKHSELVALILLSIPFAVTAQIYRSLLSAARAVSQLVRTQILADIGGAIVFVALIHPFGLRGAVLGFMAAHFILFVMNFFAARRVLGWTILRPRASQISMSVVRSNLGFGASGLVMIALSNLSVMLVSTMVIGRFGLDSNGYFANAWRIASVYLGSVTAATISYYLPTLTRCADDGDMAREVNSTLRFYLLILPPLMAAIMTGAELIVWLILSDRFQPVAPLLLVFVPAELVRIIAETCSVPFLARKRVIPFTLLFAGQATLFLAAAALFLPRLGLIGGAWAYALSVSAAAVATYLACRRSFGLRLERSTALALLRASALLASVAYASWAWPFGVERFVISGALILIWGLLNLREPSTRILLSNAMARLKPSGASR
jgi:enterobacterial common antigen flippase